MSRGPGQDAADAGPIIFSETGDNPNASTAMLQILGQKPRVVWPKDVAEERFVFPVPRPRKPRTLT
jgi:hypothetical protein